MRKFNLGGNYDLRFQLSPQQKSAITRAHNRYKSIVNNPDNFQIVAVKNKTAKSITSAAKKVKISGGITKLIIPKEKQQSVTVKRGKVVYTEKGFTTTVMGGGMQFFDESKKAFAKKLKKGEYVTVKIGGARPFERTFTDRLSLLNYMRDWKPKDDPKADLIQSISIVRVDRPAKKKAKK